jgi:large repetitive protein
LGFVPQPNLRDRRSHYSLPFTDKVEEDGAGIVRIEEKIEDYKGSEYERGHQTPRLDRTRTILSRHPDPKTNERYEILRDDYQTFLTTNILPEEIKLSAWGRLEQDINKFVTKPSVFKEAYIVTGGNGEGNRVITSKPRTANDGSTYTFNINVPDEVWKVVLIPEQAGQGPSEVTENAIAFGVLMNNINHNGEENWRNSGVSQSFSINEIESLTGLDFFSEIPDELEEILESKNDSSRINSANLLADSVVDRRFFNINSTGQSDLPQESIFTTEEPISLGKIYSDNSGRFKIDFGEIRPVNGILSQSSFIHTRPSEVRTQATTMPESSSSEVSITQTRQDQASSFKESTNSDNSVQIGFSQNGVAQVGTTQVGTTQVGTTQVGTTQIGTTEINSSEVKTSKVSSMQSAFNITDKSDSGEVSLSSSIPTQQFVNTHFNHADNSLFTNIYSTAQTLWNTPTQLNIDFQITDLPKGQLAEGTITDFDDSGVPNTGTILIDHDANGVGWFIDETPLDNSEFTAQNTDNYLLAATESEAEGKYDLLTTVLHELSHLYGFIDGYQGFDSLVAGEREKVKGKREQSNTLNPSPLTFNQGEAVFDGEHLDKDAHPYDLLNTHLAPGMRKLPSEFDVQILQAILADNDGETRRQGDGENLEAALTSDPLLAISNGDFSIADTTSNTFAWDIRGDSGIENGQVVLTEDSPFLSNFTQTFTVPEAAKTIQFKLIETELGASDLAPPDAFEVALLDADT